MNLSKLDEIIQSLDKTSEEFTKYSAIYSQLQELDKQYSTNILALTNLNNELKNIQDNISSYIISSQKEFHNINGILTENINNILQVCDDCFKDVNNNFDIRMIETQKSIETMISNNVNNIDKKISYKLEQNDKIINKLEKEFNELQTYINTSINSIQNIYMDSIEKINSNVHLQIVKFSEESQTCFIDNLQYVDKKIVNKVEQQNNAIYELNNAVNKQFNEFSNAYSNNNKTLLDIINNNYENIKKAQEVFNNQNKKTLENITTNILSELEKKAHYITDNFLQKFKNLETNITKEVQDNKQTILDDMHKKYSKLILFEYINIAIGVLLIFAVVWLGIR